MSPAVRGVNAKKKGKKAALSLPLRPSPQLRWLSDANLGGREETDAGKKRPSHAPLLAYGKKRQNKAREDISDHGQA